jgi:hypothetical protein
VLLETKGVSGQYVALSYCWGKVSRTPSLETTKSTIDGFKKGLPPERMPKTIKDAMQITKRMGFRYLWVDRLCIIQDDRADWHAEARKMGRIYENAVVTIAAVGAKDSGEGCYLPRREEGPVVLPLEIGKFFVSLPTAPVDQQTHQSKQSAWEMKQSIWSTRAWVFQERLFSRRMILYGREQVLWECRVHLETESWFGYDNGSTYKSSKYQYCHNVKDSVNKRIRKAVKGLSGSSSIIPLMSPLWDDLTLNWGDIIGQYSQLELTYEQDRLPAMEALAQTVQQQTNLEVCAGMWLGSFPQTLFWWPCWWDESEVERNGWKFPPLAGAQCPRPVRSSKFHGG